MSGASRSKGKRGEQEVAVMLRDAFPWLDPHRGAQTRKGDDACDVEGTPWFVEVKRRKARCNIPEAMEQATRDSDGRPPVVFSRRDRGEWLVTMRWEDWKEMSRKAQGYDALMVTACREPEPITKIRYTDEEIAAVLGTEVQVTPMEET